MKKLKFLLLMATLFLFGLSANVNAASYTNLFELEGTTDRDKGVFGKFDDDFKGYFSPDWSGYYLGTFDGNDSEAILVDLAKTYLNSFIDTDYYYAKVDEPDTSSDFLTISYDTGLLSGTWTLDNPYEIGFYAVKGGPEFAFYFVSPYTDSGIWSTTHLLNLGGNIPEISHLSVLAKKGTPVPEPGMVILLGIGLIGLAFYSRKRLFNQ